MHEIIDWKDVSDDQELDSYEDQSKSDSDNEFDELLLLEPQFGPDLDDID